VTSPNQDECCGAGRGPLPQAPDERTRRQVATIRPRWQSRHVVNRLPRTSDSSPSGGRYPRARHRLASLDRERARSRRKIDKGSVRNNRRCAAEPEPALQTEPFQAVEGTSGCDRSAIRHERYGAGLRRRWDARESGTGNALAASPRGKLRTRQSRPIYRVQHGSVERPTPASSNR